MTDQEAVTKLYQIVDFEFKVSTELHQLIDLIGEKNDYFKDCDRECLFFRVWLLSLNSYISSLTLSKVDLYSASIVCRCALEYSTILVLILQNKNLHHEILKFQEMFFTFNKEKDEKIYLNYLKSKGIVTKSKKFLQNYALYGWLDAIRKEPKTYSFFAATECLKKNEESNNSIYQNYKNLCAFVHPTRIYGDYSNAQTLSNYLNIINGMLTYYVDTLMISLNINDVRLTKMKNNLEIAQATISNAQDAMF